MKMKLAVFIAPLLIALSMSAYASEDKVPYPTDYRQWTHVKSMILEPGHALENPFQGIHHVYANEKAMQGLKEGKYLDGAVFVFDLLKYTQADKAIQEGERKLVGVMHKNRDAYAKTGGWGFEGFAGNSKTERLTNDQGVSCYGCHTTQENDDYVFSKYRE